MRQSDSFLPPSAPPFRLLGPPLGLHAFEAHCADLLRPTGQEICRDVLGTARFKASASPTYQSLILNNMQGIRALDHTLVDVA